MLSSASLGRPTLSVLAAVAIGVLPSLSRDLSHRLDRLTAERSTPCCHPRTVLETLLIPSIHHQPLHPRTSASVIICRSTHHIRSSRCYLPGWLRRAVCRPASRMKTANDGRLEHGAGPPYSTLRGGGSLGSAVKSAVSTVDHLRIPDRCSHLVRLLWDLKTCLKRY